MKFRELGQRRSGRGLPGRPAPLTLDPPVTMHLFDDDHDRQYSATVDLRVLLLSSGEDEPSIQAWRILLEREGVPFDYREAGSEPLTMETLEHGPGRGRYQAIVLATNSMVRMSDAGYRSSLSAAEWRALHDYECRYSVRQISAYATPSPEIGLQAPSWAGDLGDTVGSVTAAGRAVFAELVGAVPLSAGTYGFVTAPSVHSDFTSLVTGSSGSPIAGVMTHPDGREEFVVTVASAPFSRHMHLLGPGMLAWVTRDRNLGHRNFYLSVQVDDVLLGAPVPLDAVPIRMTREDVVRTAIWSRENGVRLDFAYNAWGSVTATRPGSPDPLTVSLIEYSDDFNWLNHTFDHLDLDGASEQEIDEEIIRNLDWAHDHGILVEPDSLVTGAHSGLDNPALPAASETCGVRWLASDASREHASRTLGLARTVPRHPVNIPLDVSTRDALMRRSAPIPARSGLGTIDRSAQMVLEAALMLDHMLSNDPRPHYTHQNALVDDCLLLDLLDSVLQSYRELIAREPVQLSLAAAGREMLRREAWTAAMATGVVHARLSGDAVEIVNGAAQAIDVPYTARRDRHTAICDNWVRVPAGETVTLAD